MLLIYPPSPNKYDPAPTLPVAVSVVAEITLAPVILPLGPDVVIFPAVTLPAVETFEPSDVIVELTKYP